MIRVSGVSINHVADSAIKRVKLSDCTDSQLLMLGDMLDNTIKNHEN